MNYLINFLHLLVCVLIVFICWLIPTEIYVRMFGVDTMAIIVTIIGMFAGTWLATAYYKKFGRFE